MGMGLEIYDKKGRLIIDSESIVPRFLGKYEIPLNRYGVLKIPEILYGGEIVCYFWLQMRERVTDVFVKAFPNENTEWSVDGDVINYSSDFNVSRWEHGGTGTGQTQAYDSFSHHVIVWAL